MAVELKHNIQGGPFRFPCVKYMFEDECLCSVVQGVRRWIGSQPDSSPKKMLRKVISRAEIKKRPLLSDLDRHSTEVMATQLLDPIVSHTEEAEYQGFVIHVWVVRRLHSQWACSYIDQCQELLDAPTTMGERKDLEVYSTAVKTAAGEMPDRPEEIPKDFITYVERGRIQHLEGIGRKDGLSVVFNYDRWLGGST